jgi:DNA helicase-2/ATP-dependent DNA helicase PcrA
MFLLRNIWGYQPGLVQSLGYGNALHHCLRRASEMVKNEGFDPTVAVMYAVDEGFHMPFVGGSVEDNFKDRAFEALREFAERHGADLTRIEELEYRLEFPIQNAALLGKVDVILGNRGELEVRDYKSTRVDNDDIRTHEEAETQVRLYSLGLKSMGRNVRDGSVAYLSEPRIEPVGVDEDHLSKASKLADDTVENIVTRVFNPCDGGNCNRCDFVRICRWSAEN